MSFILLSYEVRIATTMYCDKKENPETQMNKKKKKDSETSKEKYLMLLCQRENRVVRFNLLASFYHHMKGESSQQSNVIKKK